ncbi:MAG: shikimate dehydrogenase [Bacteroidales bacterium]|nr:shikimate dehydrogenase [Bacteroidales bacterium]
MKHYALIGRRLGHSWSQQWFEALFQRLGLYDYNYTLCEMSSLDGLRQWVENERISGFNVTIPYKQAIIPLLDELSPEAKVIGAVNCVCVNDGKLVGHNTDAPAFGQSVTSSPRSALILGTGGAAHAVAYALKQKGIEYLFVSRSAQGKEKNVIGYDRDTIQRMRFELIVNATPVGMWPDMDASPWPWPELLNEKCLVYDLIYNPSPTLFLRQAAAHGAATIDGTAMLHRQAELSWQLWQQ